MPARRSRTTRAPRTPRATRAGATAGLLDKLEWRLAGPFRGGRVGAVAGDPRDRNTFYFGSTGGGVWKTGDGGTYWENVSDGFFKRASVGALAVSSSARKRVALDVSRETNPGGQNDVGARARCVQPSHASVGQ